MLHLGDKVGVPHLHPQSWTPKGQSDLDRKVECDLRNDLCRIAKPDPGFGPPIARPSLLNYRGLVMEINDKAAVFRPLVDNPPYNPFNEVVPMKKMGIFLSYVSMAVLCAAVALIAYGAAN